MKKKQKISTLRYCVLIADVLDRNYQTSSCFWQVGNHYLIDYTINWLMDSCIEQIFIFYSQNKKQMQNYYQTYLKTIDIRVTLQYMKPTQIKSFGNVMRQINFRNLLADDFIILYGDSITNINLSLIIKQHQLKKQQLKNVVMTNIMQIGITEQIYLLNHNSSEILQLQSDQLLNNNNKFKINIDKVNIKKNHIDFRRDLISVEIYICTPQVLKSFKQTFQYHNMNDFINGMLTSQVYEEKIIAYILKSGQQFFRCNTPINTYLCMMNYISNNLYPYMPNCEKMKKSKLIDYQPYIICDFNRCIQKKSAIDRSTQLSNNIYIGTGTSIAQKCHIIKSFIGNNCVINTGVSLKYCIVLDNTILSANSSYQYCLVERVNQSLKNYSYYKTLCPKIDSLGEWDIYDDSIADDNEDHFRQDLINIMSEIPQQDTTKELFNIRKHNNKQLNQFITEMIKINNPQGIKGVERFIEMWGKILRNLHNNNQILLIQSLLYSCENLQSYKKAFHIFLQYSFHYNLISAENIKQWYSDTNADNKIKQMCKKFVESLDEVDYESQSSQQQSKQIKQ